MLLVKFLQTRSVSADTSCVWACLDGDEASGSAPEQHQWLSAPNDIICTFITPAAIVEQLFSCTNLREMKCTDVSVLLQVRLELVRAPTCRSTENVAKKGRSRGSASAMAGNAGHGSCFNGKDRSNVEETRVSQQRKVAGASPQSKDVQQHEIGVLEKIRYLVDTLPTTCSVPVAVADCIGAYALGSGYLLPNTCGTPKSGLSSYLAEIGCIIRYRRRSSQAPPASEVAW